MQERAELGVMLMEMLNILENFNLAGLGHNSAEYMRVVSETMKRVTSDKDQYIGDPGFLSVPIERLTSKAYASEMADDIRSGKRATVTRPG